MSERRYVLHRSAQALGVIAGVYVLVFLTLFVLPGDPIENKLTSPLNPLPPEAAENLLRYYDLDLPALGQLLLTLSRLVRGDLGYSLVSGRPVSELLAQGLSDTIVLAGLAFLFTTVLSLLVALTAVFAPWARLRAVATWVPAASISTPSFLVGFVLLSVFSFRLGLVSAVRDEGLVSYVLPALTLAFAVNGLLSQVLIAGMTNARSQPFVEVLRAKGTSETTIALRHVLKNGAIPSVTMLALIFGELLAGAVVVETVFSRTGLGFVTYEAVRDQDTPVVLAVVLLVSTIYVVLNLLTDLLYPRLDPRIVRPSSVLRRPRRAAAVEVRPA